MIKTDLLSSVLSLHVTQNLSVMIIHSKEVLMDIKKIEAKTLVSQLTSVSKRIKPKPTTVHLTHFHPRQPLICLITAPLSNRINFPPATTVTFQCNHVKPVINLIMQSSTSSPSDDAVKVSFPPSEMEKLPCNRAENVSQGDEGEELQ
jgi:hypothetical protein